MNKIFFIIFSVIMLAAGFSLGSAIQRVAQSRSMARQQLSVLQMELAFMRGANDGIEITRRYFANELTNVDQACHALYVARSNFLATLPK